MENLTELVAYSLRFDASFNFLEDEDKKKTFMDFNHQYFKKYMYAMERKQDGTEHFQGIVWSPDILSSNDVNLIRSKIRTKLVAETHRGKKGTYSFVRARKPRVLAQYCNDKEGLGMVTNVTLRERDEIGKWDIKLDQSKTDKKKEFDKRLAELKEVYGKLDIKVSDFFHTAIDMYWDVYGQLPRQTQVEKWLYSIMNDEQRKAFRYSKYASLVMWVSALPQEGYGDNHPDS